MKQKTLARLIMAAIIGVAVCAAIVYVFIVPAFAEHLGKTAGEEFVYMIKPWLFFVSGTALPVAAMLVIAFTIAVNISRDRSFCMENARRLAVISILAAADSAYFFIGNVVLLLLGMNHPGIFLFDMLVCFVGLAVTVASGALSHYTRKAAELRADADLTI
ncbi:MAG: DUF2975 domain-containing protein [Clostridiales bacterium]|nr:DUF2975 domain-containing protein [Clostridiales bacterium]